MQEGWKLTCKPIVLYHFHKVLSEELPDDSSTSLMPVIAGGPCCLQTWAPHALKWHTPMLSRLVGMHAMSPKWFNFYGFKSEEVLLSANRGSLGGLLLFIGAHEGT